MADFGDPKDLPAMLALLAPGFIILWIRSRVVEGPTIDFTQQLFYFAVVSAAYFGLIAPLFDVSWGVGLPAWLWSILFYFLVPIAIAYAVGLMTRHDLEYKWSDKLGIRFSHRIPTAWDYRFGSISEGTFVLATLKDGTTIAGMMAAGSFAAAAKDGRDLYISQVWEVPPRGGTWTRLQPERGVLICGDDLRFIEIFGE